MALKRRPAGFEALGVVFPQTDKHNHLHMEAATPSQKLLHQTLIGLGAAGGARLVHQHADSIWQSKLRHHDA